MNNTSYLVLLVCSYICHIASAAEIELRPNLEQFRAGNVFEKIDISSLPKLTTAQDCYQLCQSLIQSEIKFWTDTQKDMLESNSRLAVIVKLLTTNKDSSSLVRHGKPSLPDFGKKLEELQLREKIFINPTDPSDTTNKDLYHVYKSYSLIIRDLQKILGQYETFAPSVPTPQHHNQGEVLDKLKGALSTQAEVIEKSNLFNRGLITSDTIGKSIPQIIKGETGKFQAEMNTKIPSYAYCDVEYVTQIFVPTICEIIKNTQDGLLQKEIEKKQKVRQKKKKRREKIRILKAQEATKTQEAKTLFDLAPGVSVPDVSAVSSSSSTLKVLDTKRGEVDSETAQAQSVASLMHSELQLEEAEPTDEEVSEGVSSVSEMSKTVDAQAPFVQEGLPLASIEELYVEQECDLTPWEQYKGKPKLRASNPTAKSGDVLPIEQPFMLNEEMSSTARILLGKSDSSKDKVEMCDYIDLVVRGLKGAVLRQKKCVHFMARSLATQKWCSVAMHPLHKDDPDIIPRGTRYWKTARQLLEDVKLSEANLYKTTLKE